MTSAQFLVLDSTGPTTLPSQRHGVVRANGNQWLDDTGTFYPLGGTLFWGLRGWKVDRDRVKANLQFLAKYQFNYSRILGHVEWPGNEVDWRWAMTEDVLGAYLDWSCDQCGLRTELTLLGTYSAAVDVDRMIQAAAAVIAPRRQTILNLEMVNEGYQNGVNGDMGLMTRMSKACRNAGMTQLLALSSAEGASAYGLTFSDIRNGALNVGGANLTSIHMDRGSGDDGWRAVRQPYDWRDLSFPITHNEPIGPRSSVNEMTDPLQLAMLRANGIIHGVGAFVLHNAAGVAGQIDDRHNRPANLWEVPGIDACMQAVRNVDQFMRPNDGVGRHYNNQNENPFRVTKIWPDDGEGANRRYTVEHDDGFVSVPFAITDDATFVCRRACAVEVFDPVVGAVVVKTDVAAGASLTLKPRSIDAHGHGGFIVRGTYL